MNFQSIVLTIAVVLLIICMILIGIALAKSKNTQQWPPLIGDCPDYWVDMSQNGAQCVNIKDLGTCNGSVPAGHHLQMDFTVAPYIGQTGLCSKYSWATGCGITWDGITSGVSNPCDTPPPASN
jgi:hypothetical protein